MINRTKMNKSQNRKLYKLSKKNNRIIKNLMIKFQINLKAQKKKLENNNQNKT